MLNISKMDFEIVKIYFWHEGVPACKYWIKTLIKGNLKSVWRWFWGESKEIRKIYDRYIKSWRIAPFISLAALASIVFLGFLFLTWFMAYSKIIPAICTIVSYAIFLVMCWKVFLKWIPTALFFVIVSFSLVWSVLSLFPLIPQYFKYGIWTDWLINFCVKFIKFIDPQVANEVYAHMGYTIGHWLVNFGFIVMLLIDIPEKLFVWASIHYMGNSEFKRTNFYRHLVRHKNRNLGWWDFAKEFIYRRRHRISIFNHSTKIMNNIYIRDNDYLSAKHELIHSVQGFGASKKSQ